MQDYFENKRQSDLANQQPLVWNWSKIIPQLSAMVLGASILFGIVWLFNYIVTL